MDNIKVVFTSGLLTGWAMVLFALWLLLTWELSWLILYVVAELGVISWWLIKEEGGETDA